MSELIIDLSRVKQNYEELRRELPGAIIAYALKANYDKKILETLKGLGCAAEACSEEEYELAKRIGFEKIIVNGFVKPLKCWLQNVEQLVEKTISEKRGVRLRLKDNSKVGVNEKEVAGSWDCIAFHSSKAKQSEWNSYLNKALRLAGKVKSEHVDAGGGLNNERIKLLKRIDKKIIIEPGRSLVENACSLKTRVLMVKGNNVIIDTGLNFFNKLSMSKYEVETEKKGSKKPYRVCGPVPTDLDNIGVFNLPELKPGDELIIKNCGAYTMSMASDWTRNKPTTVYVKSFKASSSTK